MEWVLVGQAMARSRRLNRVEARIAVVEVGDGAQSGCDRLEARAVSQCIYSRGGVICNGVAHSKLQFGRKN